MKRINLLILGLLLSLMVGAVEKPVYFFTSFHEPANEGLRLFYSYDAKQWTDLGGIFLKPDVGNQKVMRDPSIVRGPDGTFHFVWTSSWRGDLGFGYASSKDLLNWSEQRIIPVMAFDTSTVNVWAPEIFYDDATTKFIIVWSSTVPFKFAKGIEDERNNHRLYYTTTTDFKTFSPTKLFYDPGYSVIDATIVQRKKNDYVLIFKDNTRPERCIKVAFGKTALGPWVNPSKSLTDFCTEGPSSVKVGGEWLIYFDVYRDNHYEAIKTKDFVTFSDARSEIDLPKGHKHGTVFLADEAVLKKVKSTKAAVELVHYSGTTLSNVDYHHGQLSPVVGVHNMQVMRASREHPELTDGFGFTYNHAPMMAYWNNTLYIEYLSDPTGEHIPPGQTLLLKSTDLGKTWSKPDVIFPPYNVPDGIIKEGNPIVSKNLQAVMHQRVGFRVSTTNRLLALGFYGVCLDPKDDPNDGNGIGRVVREIKTDGSYGSIYFLRYNHGFTEKNTTYPFYTTSKDKEFVKACDEILNNPLYCMQMVEEADRDDAMIPLKKQYKAFSYYHLSNGDVVGLWKNALTSRSDDGGFTWHEPVQRAFGFVNSNAKIWGQKTSDGRYATVYNPSEFRWPLAVSVSSDGLDYNNLLLVNGEISPMRYGGNYKSFGPQYVRGIQEGNGETPDGAMWLTYSMNKEDIWAASVPVPIRSEVKEQANDLFDSLPDNHELDSWNTYSPLWAPVSISRQNGVKCMTLKDHDAFDYARVERVIPTSTHFKTTFILTAAQNDQRFDIEFLNAQGKPSIRLSLLPDGFIRAKAGARLSGICAYKANEEYKMDVMVNTSTRTYEVWVNGKKCSTNIFFQPTAEISRVAFRTGEPHLFPTPETPADNFLDLPETGKMDTEAVYYLKSFKTEPIKE
jgi:hypothetical protein